MSVELYFSNQLEQLGIKLSENLKDDFIKKETICSAPAIIVPNNNLKKWLQMAIANNLGIAANLNFMFLESGLWKMIKSLDVDNDKSDLPVEQLNNEMMQLMLLYLLHEIKDGPEETSLIKSYLFGVNKERKDDFARRIWQLSCKLAYYLGEYEYHRPDMIKMWHTRGKEGHTSDAMELCQRYIYRRLFHPKNGLCTDINGKQVITLPQYAYKILYNQMKKIDAPKLIKSRENVHIFGLSQVSIFHQGLIGKLGEYFDIHIYAFNPCCEFWEDVETQGEYRWRIMKNDNHLKISDDENEAGELKDADNRLLQWWGKPGRENIRLLSELTDYNFYEFFCLNDVQDIEKDTILNRLQRHILFRTPIGDGKYYPLPQDRSLQIVACPGIYREVETVFNSIIYNMETDKTLNLTDIAILVPDMKKYKTAITSVFNRWPKHIPYNLCDSNAEKESMFGQAVLDLLTLAEGSFNRKDVFSLIFNPCFLERFGLKREEVQVWLDWADALNIFHCFDAHDKKMHGYSENNLHTWRNGMKRLRISRIMNTPKDTHISGQFDDYLGIIPHDISGSGDMALLEKFCEIIELLFLQTQCLRKKNLSCKDWAARITSLTDKFLTIPDEHSTEEQVRRSLLDSLRNLEVYDKLSFKDTSSRLENNKDNFLELAMITEFIKAKLISIPSGRGSFLAGGVTIAEMQPMRPIPFKIVYVMGMREGEFPGRANESSLDLRLRKRRIGDISRPETNRYMFLEVLVSTRSKLYITFVSKDLQNDEEFIPCSVVHQLRQYVESEILQDKKSFEITYIPLKSSDPNYISKKINNISDVIVNYSVADRLSYYVENGLLSQVKNRLSMDEANRLKRFEPVFNVNEIDTDSVSVVEKVTSRILRQFLENSTETNLKLRLNLYEEDDTDKSLAENEPFFTGFPIDYNLMIDSMKYCINHGLKSVSTDRELATMDFLSNYYRYNSLKGMTPEDDFSKIDKRKFKKALKGRLRQLLNITDQIDKVSRMYRWIFIGDSNTKETCTKDFGECIEFDPLQLEVDVCGKDGSLVTQRIEIHGSLPMVWQNDYGWNCLVLTARKKPDGKLPEKYVLEPFLFYLMLLLGNDSASLFANSTFTIHVLYEEEKKLWQYKLLPERARYYLRNLIADYLDEDQFDLIPFESVRNVMRMLGSSTDIDPILFEEEFKENIITNEELPELIKLSRVEIPTNISEKVKQRFSIFFEARDVSKELKES